MITPVLPDLFEIFSAMPMLATGDHDLAKPADMPVGFGYLVSGFTDITTWVAFLALVAFLAIVWRVGAFAKIFAVLDSRADRIQAELEEAKTLRAEAMQVLSDARIKAAEADKTAAAIMKSAKSEADTMLKQAEVDIAARIARQEAQIAQHIARAEDEAVRAVQNAVADMAMDAARTILSDDSQDDHLFDKALTDIDTLVSDTPRRHM